MLAPQPHLTACLRTVQLAVLNCRRGLRTGDLSPEQAADMLDAVHNLPELVFRWEEVSLERLRAELTAYDGKWSVRPDSHHSLLETFESCLR